MLIIQLLSLKYLSTIRLRSLNEFLILWAASSISKFPQDRVKFLEKLSSSKDTILFIEWTLLTFPYPVTRKLFHMAISFR